MLEVSGLGLAEVPPKRSSDGAIDLAGELALFAHGGRAEKNTNLSVRRP